MPGNKAKCVTPQIILKKSKKFSENSVIPSILIVAQFFIFCKNWIFQVKINKNERKVRKMKSPE